MLKNLSGKMPTNFSISSNHSFEDYNSNNKLNNTQSYEKMRGQQLPKLTLLQINKEKVKKRNIELLKLFKPIEHQNLNIEILEKSQFMKSNDIFCYLVACLKKERQGMINVDTISEEKAKQPKPIETKIRQFLYHSLQQSLLMSQKQVEQTKYFERLFDWFTDVFKEREMKLSFKKQSSIKRDPEFQDEDWIIRNTYKSNMPLELSQYQRKMLNINQMSLFNEKINRRQKTTQSQGQQNNQYDTQNDYSHEDSLKYQNGVQKKLFTQTMSNSPSQQKSKELLPVLERKSYLSKLTKFREAQQSEELNVFEHHWKRAKAHFEEHLTIDFYKQKSRKVGQKSLQGLKSKPKTKENNSSFSLQPKVLEKIQAARLGVTLTQFKRNKENILKEKPVGSYESPVFHPYLTTNYFHDIKKKRLETIQKLNFPNELKNRKRVSKNTEESQNLSANNIEQGGFIDETFDDIFNPKIPQNSEDQFLNSVDGLGLSTNPLQKTVTKTKKK